MNFLSRLLGRTETADWRNVRSMLTPAERDHLFHAARDRFTGAGAILDLGTWLGGSTAALAAGLASNPDRRARGQRVHAFDLFELNSYLKEHYPYPELASIPVGASFLPAFERNIAPWAAHVEAHAGDFTRFEQPLGPVELVHVDIMKNWALTNAVLRKFFRDLIPGVSMVLHQDFVHYNTVWIHLVMYRLRAHFEPVAHVPGSTTVEFKLRSAIPPAMLDHAYSFADFTPEERAATFAWSRSLIADDFLRFNIDAAEAMTPVHMGDRAAAEPLLAKALDAEAAYKAAHPLEKRRSELGQVKARLEAMTA